jgi:septum formation topological specificity factor MinE
VLGCTLDYLIGTSDQIGPFAESAKFMLTGGEVGGAAVGLPFFSVSLPNADGSFPLDDNDVSSFALPSISAKDDYAVAIANDDNSPRYAPGEVVIANRRAAVAPGAFAVIRLQNGTAVIRRVTRIEADVIHVEALNGKKTFYARADIKAIHKIIATFA